MLHVKGSELFRTWVRISNITSASTVLLLLIATDCAFIVMHLLLETRVIDTPLFSLTRDRGYPEIYQYTKEFWILILLLSILNKTKVIGYTVWIGLFLYLLLDDALQIHETFGGYIAIKFGFTPLLGLRAEDFGQLVVAALVAALLSAALILPYTRGNAAFKQVSRHLVLIILALAFFGVFVDMVHVVVQAPIFRALLAVVEDGGEMVVMSLVAWYVYLLNALDGKLDINLSKAS